MSIRNNIKDKLSDNPVVVAKIALYLQDPWGDGIRLDAVRNPTEEYQAASRMVQQSRVGETDMFDAKTVLNAFLNDAIDFAVANRRRTFDRIFCGAKILTVEEAKAVGMLRK